MAEPFAVALARNEASILEIETSTTSGSSAIGEGRIESDRRALAATWSPSSGSAAWGLGVFFLGGLGADRLSEAAADLVEAFMACPR